MPGKNKLKKQDIDEPITKRLKGVKNTLNKTTDKDEINSNTDVEFDSNDLTKEIESNKTNKSDKNDITNNIENVEGNFKN